MLATVHADSRDQVPLTLCSKREEGLPPSCYLEDSLGTNILLLEQLSTQELSQPRLGLRLNCQKADAPSWDLLEKN